MPARSNVQPAALLDPHREQPRATAQRRARAPEASEFAARAGLPIARTYWPCLLDWIGGDPTAAALERMRHAARSRDRKSMLLPIAPRMEVLLIAGDSLAGATREKLEEVVSALLEIARGERPGARIHAVVGPRIGSGESVATAASHLCQLERYALARGEAGVTWAPGYSFACLLETHARHGCTSMQAQLARLAAYDREHGTDLQRVLELALDHGNRNVAARAAFMHRNTFRRKLRTALGLVDTDLDCPEDRLALHLALKLRSLSDHGD